MGEGVYTIGIRTNRSEKWGNGTEQNDHIYNGLSLDSIDKIETLSRDTQKQLERAIGKPMTNWDEKDKCQAIAALMKKQGYSDEAVSAIYDIYKYTTNGDNTDSVRDLSSKIRNGQLAGNKMIDGMESFIKESPKFGKSTYRGMAISTKDYAKLRKGASVDMNGISSWSTDMDMAKEFASHNKSGNNAKTVIFVSPKQPRGTSVSHLSGYGEGEVLVSHTARYKVDRIEEKGGYAYVYLKTK